MLSVLRRLFSGNNAGRSRKELDIERVRQMRADGASVLKIAAEFGCAVETVRLVMVRAGLETSRQIDTSIKRRKDEIIALRAGGATYQAIGERFGITRERVRQILIKSGRGDLARRMPSEAFRRAAACQHCGGQFHPRGSAQKYCSVECRNASMRGKRRTPPSVAIALLREREQGATWERAAQARGIKSGAVKAMQIVARAAVYGGWDISWARGYDVQPQPGAVDAMLAKATQSGGNQ